MLVPGTSAALELAGQLLLAVAAGLLLNLTPCVLPAIPVKVRTIVRESGQHLGQRSLAAVTFTAGSLLFFLALGLATAALHWTWGELFQSRAFLVLLIAFLCAFAVTTFLDLAIPAPQFAQTLRGRRYLEPFLSGAFSALLATPCTGPFLGGVLAYAITRPPTVILAIFLCVGLGLALPYVIMLLNPRLLNRLPAAGQWSERVRQALAFVLLAAAAFFVQSLIPADWGRWVWIAWAALLIAWAIFAALRSTAWSARAVATGFAIAGVAVVYAGGLVTPPQPAMLHWVDLRPGMLQQVEQMNRPALVEFTADWCINCKVLEKTVYADARVTAAVHKAGMAMLRADLTRPVPHLEKMLTAYGGAGLPYAVVLDRHGHVVQSFPGLFTTGSLVQAIVRSAEADPNDA